jgi:hypothetical protein
LTTSTEAQKSFSIVSLGTQLNPNIQVKGGDFHTFVNILSANFSVNYFENNSLALEKIRYIFNESLDINWSKEYFFSHVRRFLKVQKFPNFTAADFFNLSTPKLKTHAEYLKMLEEHGESVNTGRVIFRLKNSYLWAYYRELTPESINAIIQNYKCKVDYAS